MNILVVSQRYWPELFNINDICEELVKRGHKVRVLTGLPNYPKGVIPEEYQNGRNRIQEHNGVEIIRAFEIPRGNGNPIKRALNYFSYMFSAPGKVPSLGDYDVIFGYQTSPIYQMKAALRAKKLTGKPFFLYCCDLWPASLLTKLSSKKSLLFKLTHNYSRKVYGEANLVGVTSKSFINYLVNENNVAAEKLCYIPQHANEIFLKVEAHTHLPGEKTKFVFAGNVGIAQGVETIIYAAREIKEKDFLITILGEGVALDSLKKLTALYHLEDKIDFAGWHHPEEIPGYYSQSDACLLTLKRIPAVELTLPAKLQGYMASGKPIFAAIEGESRRIIEETACGGCVNAEDYKGLARLMADFIDYPEKYADCGANARKYFYENFTKANVVDQLESRLLALCGTKEETKQ